MLSYQHIFHAGNFADVHKHIVILHTLTLLQRSATPIAVIDTHAGEGVYDLQSDAAQKNREAAGGILRLADTTGAPPIVGQYLKVVSALNSGPSWRYYPGSPELLRRAARASDRLTLIERHPRAAAALKRRFQREDKMRIIQDDAFVSLANATVPRGARPFVIIDPAYEKAEEWRKALAAVAQTVKRWPAAVILLWYPITAAGEFTSVTGASAGDPPGGLIKSEFYVLPNDVHRRLNGSGMLIANPPADFAESLEPALAWLYSKLAAARAPHWQIKSANS